MSLCLCEDEANFCAGIDNKAGLALSDNVEVFLLQRSYEPWGSARSLIQEQPFQGGTPSADLRHPPLPTSLRACGA